MPLTLEEIIEETRHLPADVVANLVDRILVARHGGIESKVATAWKTEVERRIEEIEQGKVQGIPAEESLTRIGQDSWAVKCKFHPAADEEFAEAVHYYAKIDPSWVCVSTAKSNE